MQRGFRRLVPVLLGVLTVGILVIGAGAAGPSREGRRAAREAGRHVRLRRHAAGSHGEVRQGRRDADLQGADEGRHHGRQRDDARVPAEHRRRLVHDGHRHVSRPSTARRTTPTSAAGTRSRTARRSPAAGTMQADTIANAAERAGKKVASIDWVGGAAAGIAGPVVDFTNFFSNRGVLVGQNNVRSTTARTFFGVDYEIATISRTPPAGRASRPATRRRRRSRRRGRSARRSRRRTRTAPTTSTSTTASTAAARTTTAPSSARSARRARRRRSPEGRRLPAGQADGGERPDRRAGDQTVGHYIKLISLAPNLSNFKLYDTSLARAIATCGAVCNSLPGRRRRRGQAGEVHRRQPAAVGRGRLRAARKPAWSTRTPTSSRAVTSSGPTASRSSTTSSGTLQPDTDFAMVGYPFTDEVSHQFMGARHARPTPTAA